jgi:IS605 OrfB family transposase
VIITYKYRIKDSTSRKRLCQLAGCVSFVWNYINKLSFENIKQHNKFLSNYAIDSYTAGSSKELPLHSTTIQEISKTYVKCRKASLKRRLSWRSVKRGLGWIPFKGSAIKVVDDKIIYLGKEYKFYKSRPILGNIKTGSFNQDCRGRWYINFIVDIPNTKLKSFPNKQIGIDLGVKDKLTLSNGIRYTRENLTKKHEDQLARAQRAGHKRRAANIHAKIKNCRMDWNHKVTTEICNNYEVIIAGDIQVLGLIEDQTKNMRKNLLDSSPYEVKCYLKYKAQKLGNTYKEVNEAFTTMKCNTCGALTGPHGKEDLYIREWECNLCHAKHDRDINAAKNILRIGHDSP